MTTARDIITSALRKIHVVGIGASLNAEEADQALDTLNNMLSSFSAEGALIFTESLENFPLVGNQEAYTVGPGLDFNTIAPLYIKAAYVRQGQTDYPLEEYDESEYAGISQKSVSGSVPRIYYYNANFVNPTIFLYPVPSSDTFFMSSRKPLTSFSSLDAIFEMPEQYKAMLIYNLAVWIAPEYERDASPTVMRIANSSKKAVIAQNDRNEKHASLINNIPGRSSSNQYTDHNIFGGYYT